MRRSLKCLVEPGRLMSCIARLQESDDDEDPVGREERHLTSDTMNSRHTTWGIS